MEHSKSKIEQIAASVPWWWHSIDLGHGVITKGVKCGGDMSGELKALRLPDVAGKAVLDIGAMDGFYSFEAERRGARRVVAVDYYSWSLDLPKHFEYMRECRERGILPKPDQETPNWRPLELPGKRGYDTAHQALESKVETVVDDFMHLDPKKLGTFDIVLFLGVLYHLEDPLQALKHLSALTREVAIIETAAVSIPGFEHLAFAEFFETSELEGDMSNWWAPNMKALCGLCRAAGFRRIEIIAGPPWRPIVTRLNSCFSVLLSDMKIPQKLKFNGHGDPKVDRYRAIVHAWK
jgi:tRNA (mo5U34)-methyltransferase